MEFQEFPKCIYKDGAFVIVESAEEEKARNADGFYAIGEQLSNDAEQPADEKADLQAKLTAKGIEYDARWGVKKLREALGE